jgi:aminodeoxychorismate synthase component I
MSPQWSGCPERTAILRWDEIDPARCDLVEIFEGLRVEACPWWLDSALQDDRLGRFSFAGADPWLVARVYGDRLEVHCRRPVPGLSAGMHVLHGDPFDGLRALLPRIEVEDDAAPPELPFIGGAVGYLGYEMGAFAVPVSLQASDGSGFPDATLLGVDRLLAVDHVRGRAFALGWGFGDDPAEARRRAGSALEAARAWLEAAPPRPARVGGAGRPDWARRRELLRTAVPASATSSLGRSAYEARVRALIREIEAGNVYEANLTRRLSLDFDGDPFRLYRALRRESPAPFACFLELPEGAILSSSPERFLRLDAGRRVESRPIKGTRPRGATPREDAGLREALARSEKDRAENLMIVDLVRNDLGRVCEVGSVRVPELMVVEAYASVFQLVSTVVGRLRRDRDAIDLVRAAFPPGSMTGAPKIAAMRLCSRLEPVRRGVYSGAIGWIDVRGGLDLSVVIRTLLVEKDRVHLHVGGAVVADSSPSAEYDETDDKARAGVAAWAAVRDP